MFLVSGITGHVGGATARQLLKDGHRVRALVRDPQKGVEIHRGDFNDSSTLAKALTGVEAAFLMLPPVLIPEPGFPEAKAILTSFQEALRQSPPLRLVSLSSVGSEKNSGLGNITTTHLLEEALGDLPFPTAFVRAGGFLENYIGTLESVAATGVFHSFFQPTGRPFPVIATADIGKEVARLLVNGWNGKKIIELGSPITPDEIAHAMGEVLNRPVRAQAVPREEWAATLQHLGFPPGSTGLYEEMMDGFNSGWIAFGVPGTESVSGTTSPAQVFAQAKKP